LIEGVSSGGVDPAAGVTWADARAPGHPRRAAMHATRTNERRSDTLMLLRESESAGRRQEYTDALHVRAPLHGIDAA
jgi:hypothetical protein